MKMKRILFILVVLSLMLFAAGCKTPLKENIEDARECISNTDCIKVQTSCCSCNIGGPEQCISIAAKPLYDSLIEGCPKNPICTETNNCNIQNCTCQENKCVPTLKE